MEDVSTTAKGYDLQCVLATYRHGNTTQANIRAEPLTYSGALPEDSEDATNPRSARNLERPYLQKYCGYVPVSISVHDAWKNIVGVCTCTNEQ